MTQQTMPEGIKQKVYLAYGSNLNRSQMEVRCPDALEIGKFLLPDYRLVFRGVADIEKAKGFHVPVGLGQITKECEKALDRYEGFPTLYRKQYFRKDETLYMAYVMNRTGYAKPPQRYYESIKEGYVDFGMPTHYLLEALEHSIDNNGSNGYIPKKYRNRAKHTEVRWRHENGQYTTFGIKLDP